MSDVIALGGRRAASTSDATKVSPRDLLLGIIAELDSGALKPTHIIVVAATTDENLDTTFQINHAGIYDRFGQIGMLASAQGLIQS